MSASTDISVVVPCHNERDSLGPLATEIHAALAPLNRSYEVLLVDDGSTDDTWAVIGQLGQADPRVRGVRLAVNCGQSAALWAGLQEARGAVIVTLDADGQNPPAEMPKLLAALDRADCACGSRVAARAQGDSWLRRASSRIANGVRNKLSGETIADAGCCYRAFRRACVAHVKFFNGAHRFLPTLIKLDGFTVTEVPIAHRPRTTGQSHYGVWNRLFKSFTDLLAVRWMKQRAIRYTIHDRVN